MFVQSTVLGTGDGAPGNDMELFAVGDAATAAGYVEGDVGLMVGLDLGAERGSTAVEQAAAGDLEPG